MCWLAVVGRWGPRGKSLPSVRLVRPDMQLSAKGPKHQPPTCQSPGKVYEVLVGSDYIITHL